VLLNTSFVKDGYLATLLKISSTKDSLVPLRDVLLLNLLLLTHFKPPNLLVSLLKPPSLPVLILGSLLAPHFKIDLAILSQLKTWIPLLALLQMPLAQRALVPALLFDAVDLSQ